MNKTVIVILILVVIVVILAIVASYAKPFFVDSGKKILTVGSQTFEVGIADNILARAQGLSGRPSLGETEGLFFIFPFASSTGFWMKDMNFPIDIVWINGGKVIGFSENLQPGPGKSIFVLPRYYPPEPVDRVLEVNAGAVKQYNFAEGDEVGMSL